MRHILVRAFGSNVPQTTIDLIERGSRQVRHQQNEVVYHQGATPDGLYVVCHGGVLLEWKAPNGFTAAFRLATAVECFGHRSFCGNEARSTVARCITSTLLMHVPAKVLKETVGHDPGFFATLAWMLARDAGPKLSKITRNGRTPVRVRLAFVLADLTRRLQSSAAEERMLFEFPLKQKDLANLLDVSQETISRTLHDFESDGLLQIEHGPRRLLINDRAQLEAIAYQHE